MPEGPETVKSVRLLREIIYKNSQTPPKLEAVYLYGRRFNDFEIEKLTPALGTPLVNITSKGKFYFFEFGSGHALCAHHGLEGYWSFGDVDRINNVHLRIDFVRSDGSRIALWWVNKLSGRIYALTQAEYQKKLLEIAPAIIGDYAMTKQMWFQIWSTLDSKVLLRTLLMDQHRLCSGIGNYLIAEIYYELKMNPNILVGKFGNGLDQVSFNNVSFLYDTILRLMTEFTDGSRQKYVYMQSLSPNGNKITPEAIGGRSFWWCPAEQTLI